MITWLRCRTSKNSIIAVIAMVISLVYSYIFIYLERSGDSILSCTSNVYLDFSEGSSLGPVISGILYVRLNNGGDGFLEISGSVKWHGNTYPVSKRINIVHDILYADGINLVAIQMTSTISLENDTSPQGLIEKLFVGESSLSSYTFSYKKSFYNGYYIGNLRSPIAICIDS